MSTTLQDVAKEAGVSMKTVSRVVNNERNVAEDTRRHVLRVITELGYVPHVQAQPLASGKTRSIVLHYPLSDPGLISNEIEMNFITGIAFGAAEEEYFFSLMTGQLTHIGLQRLCRGASADGLVLMQIAMDDWRVELLRDNDFVMIGRTANNDGLSWIDLDFESAVLEAYAHLIGLGHRHIGFLTFSEDWRRRGLGPAVRTLRGFTVAVDKFHLAPLYRQCQLEVERAQAVSSAVRELGYVHNTLARSLARSRSNSVGVALTAITNIYFSEIVQAIEAECAANNHTMLLADTHDESRQELRAVQTLHQRRVDGIILAPSFDPEQQSLRYLTKHSVPVVLVDRMISRTLDQVGVENKQSTAQLVTHLLSHGHRLHRSQQRPGRNSNWRDSR